MKYLVLAAALVGASLSGCGEIQDSTRVASRTGENLVAGIGDTIFQADHVESLPNIAGKADIYGRTRPTGTTTLVYHGVSGNRAMLLRQDVDIHSDADVFTNSPTIISMDSTTTYSGSIGGTRYQGSSDTSGAPIFIPAKGSTSQVTGRRDMNILIPLLDGQNSLPIAGKVVTVHAATPTSIKYSVN